MDECFVFHAWEKVLCPQVHCMALLQGVQEGGEMNVLLFLPGSGSRVWKRIESPVRVLKSLGLFLSAVPLARCRRGNTPIKNLLKILITYFTSFNIYKVSKSENYFTFFKRPKQARLRDFFSVLICTKKKSCLRRKKKEEPVLEWTFHLC